VFPVLVAVDQLDWCLGAESGAETGDETGAVEEEPNPKEAGSGFETTGEAGTVTSGTASDCTGSMFGELGSLKSLGGCGEIAEKKLFRSQQNRMI
jgi:hypothetical protein